MICFAVIILVIVVVLATVLNLTLKRTTPSYTDPHESATTVTTTITTTAGKVSVSSLHATDCFLRLTHSFTIPVFHRFGQIKQA